MSLVLSLCARESYRGFSPKDISSLALWLDASDVSTITEAAGSVSQWDDKSGNNNNVTQGTASRQPTTNSVTIGSKNAIDFDGSDYMNFTDTISGNSGYTAFVIIRPDDLSANPKTMFSGNPGCFNLRIDNSPLQTQIVRTNQAILLAGSDTPAIDTDYIVSARTSAAGNNAHINGINIGSNATNPNYSTGLSLLGAQEPASPKDFFTGSMGEVIIYTGIKTDAEMNQVGNYLQNAWGISWTNI